jgi:hypothetical protein
VGDALVGGVDQRQPRVSEGIERVERAVVGCVDRVGTRLYGIVMRTLMAIICLGQAGRWLVAYNPQTGTTTLGKTAKQALANLKEGAVSQRGRFA